MDRFCALDIPLYCAETIAPQGLAGSSFEVEVRPRVAVPKRRSRSEVPTSRDQKQERPESLASQSEAGIFPDRLVWKNYVPSLASTALLTGPLTMANPELDRATSNPVHHHVC